jgi:hypothetical protein
VRTAAEGTSADMDTKLDCSSTFQLSSSGKVGELVTAMAAVGNSVGAFDGSVEMRAGKVDGRCEGSLTGFTVGSAVGS